MNSPLLRYVSGQLFRDKLQHSDNFHEPLEALKIMTTEPNVAYFGLADPIHFFTDYHCQLASIWKDPYPIVSYSMYMKKDSPLTPFIKYQLIKMKESGITQSLYKKHSISPPNCEPRVRPAKSLNMHKYASVFAIICTGLLLSWFIFMLEIMGKQLTKPNEAQEIPNWT